MALRLLELISPTAIISHVLSTEQRRIIKTGIIHHSDNDFPLHVYIRIIVPSIFRRINAKPTEHIVRSRDNYLLSSPVRPNDNIIRELQIHRPFRAFHRDLILYRTGKSRYFLHRLEITIAISRLKT